LVAVGIGLGLMGPGVGRALKEGGNHYPARLVVEGRQLELVGAGTREVTFMNIDVYTMGVYSEQASCESRQLVQQDVAKLIQMDFLRDVPGGKMASGLSETFERRTPKDASPELRAQIRTFVRLFKKDIPRGSRARILYVPGQGTTLSVAGKPLGAALPGQAFQKVLWAIWFHRDSCCPSLLEKIEQTCKSAARASHGGAS
jgi:hypothetical protein